MNINESEILFKKFKLVSCFKKNEHSAVYLADHIFLDKKVFLKILHIASIPDESITNRFKREAKILAKLNHPNIIDVYDFGIYKEFFYISFEYFESQNLRELLSTKNITEETRVKILIQISKGLCYAHQNNVIHRDIKPENILVNDRYEVKLTDFGLAQESVDNYLTHQFSIIGTPAYMSPEQINGEGVTEKSDLFSLGITIFELFVGKNPFLGIDANETVNNIISFENFDTLENIKDLTNEIQQILQGLLVSESEERFDSCDQILAILHVEAEESKNIKTKKFSPIQFTIIVIFLPLFIWVIFLLFPNEDMKTEITPISDTVQHNKSGNSKVSEEMNAQELDKVESGPLQKQELNDLEIPVQNEKTSPKNEIPNKIEKVNYGELFIKCYPWAEVYINEEFIETTPLTKNIIKPVGKYLLKLSHPNYPSYEDSIKILPDKLEFVEVNLDTLFGFLDCKVYPWGEVFLNNESLGVTPIQQSIKLLPGEYELKITNPNLNDYMDVINVKRNDTLFLKINLE